MTARRSPRRAKGLVIAALLLVPGCVIGSPLAAVGGKPYGMTSDDVQAIRGERDAFWSHAPILAGLDLPFAAVLDTALLPLALVMWAIDEDPDEERYDDEPGIQPLEDGELVEVQG